MYPKADLQSSQVRQCCPQRNRCEEHNKENWKTVWVLVVFGKDNRLLRKLLQSVSGGSTNEDTVQNY